MRYQRIIAFVGAMLVGGAIGSGCYVAQPQLECSPLPPYWAQYTLVSGTGECAGYAGDMVDIQRYLPPGSDTASIAILPYRVGSETRVRHATGEFVRFGEGDPNYEKESAKGKLASLTPADDGTCSAPTLSATEQNLPEAIRRLPKGAEETLPATSIKYAWSNFRMLNTARFPGTLFDANVSVTVDGCAASYKVSGIHPVVGCATDEDCNPEANVKEGRVVGSGMSADYKPKCSLFAADAPEKDLVGGDGICLPTVSFDDLTKLD